MDCRGAIFICLNDFDINVGLIEVKATLVGKRSPRKITDVCSVDRVNSLVGVA